MKKITIVSALGYALCAAASTALLSISMSKAPQEPLNDKQATRVNNSDMLIGLGMDVKKEFEDGNVIGYAMMYQGTPVMAYSTDGGKHVVIGELLNASGENLSVAHREVHLYADAAQKSWDLVTGPNGIADTNNKSGPMLYTVMDPNCSHCLRFWEQTRQLVENGTIQMTHLLVGILGQDSKNKSASIMGSESPAETLEMYMSARSNGSSYTLDEPKSSALEELEKVNDMLSEANIRGTPTSFYKNSDGEIKIINGAETASNVIQAISE